MFQPYESKPTTRMAFQITSEMHVYREVYGPESTYRVDYKGISIQFKAYQNPVIGDWVVRLTETDTYLCTDAVFRERNIVPEETKAEAPVETLMEEEIAYSAPSTTFVNGSKK